MSLIFRLEVYSEELDSFCLHIQYLNPYQCSTWLVAGYKLIVWLSVCPGRTYAGVHYSICKCLDPDAGPASTEGSSQLLVL